MGKSHQKGWVSIRGKKWYGYFRRTVTDPLTNQPKNISTPVALGLRSEMTKHEARERLEVEIARLTGQLAEDGTIKNGTVTFGWFVRNRYLPLKEADWREGTVETKKYLLEADLVKEFEDIRLENFDKFILQNHLNQLAKTRSRDRVLQMRAYLRSIFSEAVDQDFLSKDPARRIKPPAHLRPVDKTTLSWDQLRLVLQKLDELSLRDWILMKLEMSNALRPSELFPLRWRCFLEEERVLDIQETLYKGKLRSFGKTKGSLTKVPIADVLADELVSWREQCRRKGKDVSPDGFIFAGRFGEPMDPNNYRKRVLHKLAAELELPKLTFQVIRRTIATLGKTKGHVKDIQGLMRHSKASTTTDIYMQSLEPEVRAAVNSIHAELMGPRTSGRGPQLELKNQLEGERKANRPTVVPLAEGQPKRGVILEFATRMRQSRGREEL